MQRRGPQSGQWQVRQAPRHGRGQPLQLLRLMGVKCTQLMGERARDFGPRDLLEGIPQVSHPAADGAGGQIRAQACQALIEYGFREMRLPRLTNGVVPDNIPSWRLCERLGFRKVKNVHPDGTGYVWILDNLLVGAAPAGQ